MQEYLHPVTGVKAHGVRLGLGATLMEGDLFPSTSGKWEPLTTDGVTLMPGCEIVWVRPVGLSLKGRHLLERLKQTKYLLADVGYWKLVPSISFVYYPNLDWRVGDTRAVEELIELGLIAQHEEDQRVYEMTSAGIEQLCPWNGKESV